MLIESYPGIAALIRGDLRAKAAWCYEHTSSSAIIKVLLTDGTVAMLLYRLMQWAHRRRLVPVELLANRLNAILCNCIIGRGAEFGAEFVLIHATRTLTKTTIIIPASVL